MSATLDALRAERAELQRRVFNAVKATGRGAKWKAATDKLYDRLDEIDGLIEVEMLKEDA